MNIHIPLITGGGYEKFWTCKKRYKVIKGGRMSKKSCTAALWYIFHIMKFYHVHNEKPCLLVVRRYLNTHRTSTRSQLLWAIEKLGVSHLWHIPKSELTLTYKPSGQVILFRGADDMDSITSITVPTGHLCWLWIEESYQINNEHDFNKLDLSFRGNLPDPLFKQVTMTFNPWNNLIWIKPRFFDKSDPDVFTDTTNYTCNEFLGVDDFKIFDKMRKDDPRRFKIEGLGEWGNIEGLVYAGYADNPEKNHAELPENERLAFITCGLDYGSGSPGEDSKLGKTCLIACAITADFSKVYVIRESFFNDFFLPDRITKWVIDFLLALQADFPGVDIICHCEYASSDAFNNALKLAIIEQNINGIEIVNAFKSSILDRIDMTQILFGEKRLLLTSNVPNMKQAFSNALWDTKKSKLKGVPIRLDDGTSDIDSLDAFEYAVIKYANYLLAAKVSDNDI
jgi:PBSX family phage terminase large subunit